MRVLEMGPIGFIWINRFWQFLRPHAFLGTLFQYMVILAFAVHSSDLSQNPYVWTCLLTIILIHIYGMGLSHLTDVPVEHLNQLRLPMASKTLGFRLGILITAYSGLFGLLLAAWHGHLFILVNSLLLLGLSLYSLPPFRLKSKPILAALTMATSKSLLFVGGYYLVLAAPQHWHDLPVGLMVFLGFMFFFAFGLALTNSSVGLAAGRNFQLASMSANFGAPPAVRVAFVLQLLSVSCSMIAVMKGWIGESPLVLALLHLPALAALWFNYVRLDANQNSSLILHYQNLWKILYWQILIFFLIALGA